MTLKTGHPFLVEDVPDGSREAQRHPVVHDRELFGVSLRVRVGLPPEWRPDEADDLSDRIGGSIEMRHMDEFSQIAQYISKSPTCCRAISVYLPNKNHLPTFRSFASSAAFDPRSTAR